MGSLLKRENSPFYILQLDHLNQHKITFQQQISTDRALPQYQHLGPPCPPPARAQHRDLPSPPAPVTCPWKLTAPGPQPGGAARSGADTAAAGKGVPAPELHAGAGSRARKTRGHGDVRVMASGAATRRCQRPNRTWKDKPGVPPVR